MSIASETQDVINQRFHTAQMMSLSGVGHWHDLNEEHCTLADPDVEECGGTDPLDLLERDIHMALETVVWAKIHTHVPDDNGFCIVCRWDLNA